MFTASNSAKKENLIEKIKMETEVRTTVWFQMQLLAVVVSTISFLTTLNYHYW